MWRFIIAAPFFIHGLAHISGFLASWTQSDAGFKRKSWIFSLEVFLNNPIGRVFGLLWLLAMLGFIGTAIGIVFQQPWWSQLAIAASVISLIVILLWWNTVPPGAKIGAIFDVLIIVVCLLPVRERILELIG